MTEQTIKYNDVLEIRDKLAKQYPEKISLEDWQKGPSHLFGLPIIQAYEIKETGPITFEDFSGYIKKEKIQGLEGLFDVIRGVGPFGFFGKGIHTWPERGDEIYNACLELEDAGLIYRKIDEPGHVFWMAIGDK